MSAITPADPSKFNIQLVRFGAPSAYDALFQEAADRWASFISRDLPAYGALGKDWFLASLRGKASEAYASFVGRESPCAREFRAVGARGGLWPSEATMKGGGRAAQAARGQHAAVTGGRRTRETRREAERGKL